MTSPQVLYVGGWGRSGSTLLAHMLGPAARTCVGRRAALRVAGGRPGRRAVRLRPSPSPMHVLAGGRRGAFGGWDNIDVDEVLALEAACFATETDSAFGGAAAVSRPRREAPRYAEHHRAACIRRSPRWPGAGVVVDSTKNPPYAYFLRRASDLDLRVVHLVRDSRGVVFSWMKKIVRPGGHRRRGPLRGVQPASRGPPLDGVQPRLRAAATRLRTLDRPGCATSRSPGSRGRELERSARPSRPRRPSDLAFLDSGEVEVAATSTAIRGNPMRFAHGRQKLRVDDAWRSQMARPARRVVTARHLAAAPGPTATCARATRCAELAFVAHVDDTPRLGAHVSARLAGLRHLRPAAGVVAAWPLHVHLAADRRPAAGPMVLERWKVRAAAAVWHLHAAGRVDERCRDSCSTVPSGSLAWAGADPSSSPARSSSSIIFNCPRAPAPDPVDRECAGLLLGDRGDRRLVRGARSHTSDQELRRRSAALIGRAQPVRVRACPPAVRRGAALPGLPDRPARDVLRLHQRLGLGVCDPDPVCGCVAHHDAQQPGGTSCAFSMFAAFVPVVFSLNRGLWLSLGVGILYAALRLGAPPRLPAGARHRWRDHLHRGAPCCHAAGQPRHQPLQSQDRRRRRLQRDQAATQQVLAPPGPRAMARRTANTVAGQSTIGTESEVFLLVYSHGIPGLALFFLWFATRFSARRGSASRTHSGRTS